MAMKKDRIKKHNVDIIFLMVLFLIFTFSAVSVLLMAVNSYRSVVYANEENANTRTAVAYVRERVRSYDNAGAVQIIRFDDRDAIEIDEGDGIQLIIYCYDGYLMELETKEGAGVTPDFGNKIIEVNNMELSWKNSQLIELQLEDANGENQVVEIGIKSRNN